MTVEELRKQMVGLDKRITRLESENESSQAVMGGVRAVTDHLVGELTRMNVRLSDFRDFQASHENRIRDIIENHAHEEQKKWARDLVYRTERERQEQISRRTSLFQLAGIIATLSAVVMAWWLNINYGS